MRRRAAPPDGWSKPERLLPAERALVEAHGEILDSIREAASAGQRYTAAPYPELPGARDAYQSALNRLLSAEDRLYEAKRRIADAHAHGVHVTQREE